MVNVKKEDEMTDGLADLKLMNLRFRKFSGHNNNRRKNWELSHATYQKMSLKIVDSRINWTKKIEEIASI